MSTGIGAHGTLVAWGPVGGPYVTIGELQDIEGPELVRNVIEAPCQTDTWMHKVAGMANLGDLTFTVNLLPGTTHAALLAQVNAGTAKGFQLTYPDAATCIFAGFVSGIVPSAPVDDVLTAEITVTGYGAPVFA